MIRGDKEISAVFCIFHDGRISSYRMADRNLELEIEISYLAERIDQNYTKFFLYLHNVRDFAFNTWPKNPAATPRIICDPSQVFVGEPDILEGRVENGRIEVALNQPFAGYDYCGGMMTFTADAAQVIDEGEKQYDIDELSELSKACWDQYSNNSE